MTDHSLNRIERYGAELEHPWTAQWRIPRVYSPYPEWKFEVALCVPDARDPTNLWGATEPSEEEARIIGWYINYRRTWYLESWQQQMLQRPFDIDPGTITIILMRAEDGWTYRRATFQHGPWPFHNDERRNEFPPTPEGLLALLDHIGKYSPWPKWKADNPLPAAEVGA